MSTHNVKMNQTEHFRKYDSITRMGHKDSHGVLEIGDMIAVWEKLDGSNASFKLVGDEVVAFSRNLPLNEENNLNGFYQWTQTLDKSKLTAGVTYYGEWLVPHKVDYGENARQFYLFDVWQPKVMGLVDGAGYEYADTWEVAFEAEELGINLAPLLYVGPYKGYAHLQTMVGRSVLAVDPLKGEGIVVKNHKYRSKHGTYVWLKMVSESFAEVKKVKPPRDPSLDNEATQLARECTTQARVEKAIDRLIEQNMIAEDDLDLTNMGKLIPVVGKAVAVDTLAEETPDGFDKQFVTDVEKMMGKLVPMHLRKIIEARTVEAME
jgi:hypothetical protein